MGKHFDKNTKYHYVMRYKNGESAIGLGMEIGLKNFGSAIYDWNKKFNQGGICALASKTGTKTGVGKGRPKKINYDELSKNELIKIIKIKDEFIDHLKKKTRPRFIYRSILYVAKKHKVSLAFVCLVVGVSRSGYYKWLVDQKQIANYKTEWLSLINAEYHLHKGNYGAERIWASLTYKNILKVNVKTIKRYMRFLGLKAKIRIPRKPREIKTTTKIETNYINQDFRDNMVREKLFTDTTHYRNASIQLYFSAVLSTCGNYLLDLQPSLHNNAELVQENITKSIRKVGKKYFIHFDNAAFYKNEFMINLIGKTGGIRSYNYPGKSLDNRPIEYFFSILKHEYLRIYQPQSLAEAHEACQKIMMHYNHVRLQKNLNWKTPANARV